MKRFISKKTVALGLAAGLILGASGAAFAYFTAIGSGDGNATVGSTGTWLVSQDSSAGTIYPGSATSVSTISYSVQNSGTADQAINSVTTTIKTDVNGDAETILGASITGCKAAWFSVSDVGHPTYAASIAGGGTVNGTAVVSMPTLDTDQNACQGALPGVTISVA